MGRGEGSAGAGRATTPSVAPPGEPELSARERILAAAEVLFAEHRFDRTSTARIAAAAGVPHGLIFYHFKTKMDLLLAVVQRDRVTTLGELDLPAPDLAPSDVPSPDLPAPDLPAPDVPSSERAESRRAIAELWRHLTVVLGRPSPVHRIVLQELAVHEEIRRRAMESTDAAATVIAGRLARIFGCDVPTPEQVAAAQLLTFAASMAPLLDQPDHTLVDPDALAALLAQGLSPPDA
ncbi:transcriptional regulator, TetR family [Frankia torreyi]|uniref:Transcriptional regulator, TetR family n=1 Tax=Frankia torreyi TaxID=1856 RepID=A0A0D8BA49_9ACTN|nr:MULTISPECIES: TetR/AcrR family transcriptional regulator [Frankia]KJE20227.1 transcriptional regulator, TetR family [Frankia torreyi]KQC38162.1 transcriptional regulator [Frankia sp. ACN1ag]KQM02532.1 transcriptional regulator, TetR family [Frankia sp. CpI1-P]